MLPTFTYFLDKWQWRDFQIHVVIIGMRVNQTSTFNINFIVFRFKIDKNYVGTPPLLEITIGNLNDNIDRAFLADMMNKVGPYEELTIFYHPITNRHLGFARIVFQDVKYSRLCIDKYNGRSVMGQVS